MNLRSACVPAAALLGACLLSTGAVALCATDEAPATSAGQTRILAAAEQSNKVGAIFSSDSITAGNHYCTASVVDSPRRDMIVTAAHCLTPGDDSHQVFVPGYRDGTAPAGTWHITQVIEDPAWSEQGDEDADLAFALVAPQNEQDLETAVGGGYTLSATSSTDTPVTLTGYPSKTDEPISCTSTDTAYSDTQMIVGCPAFTGGTSGSAWLGDYDAASDSGNVIGVIGGHHKGGTTADTSYSSRFDQAAVNLYRRALDS